MPQFNSGLQQFRKNHDFSPDNAIEIVAPLIRKSADPVHFARVLQELPDGAAESGRRASSQPEARTR
jgi:hypothetical protein